MTERRVTLLAARGVNASVKDHKDGTPLRLAAKDGHPEASRNSHGGGFLAELCKHTGLESAALAGRGGALVTDACCFQLHRAANGGHLEVVKQLLATPGVEVNARGDNDRTPLHFAARGGRVEVAQQLLAARGVDVNAKDFDGTTPLHIATEAGHVEVAQQLMSARGVCAYGNGGFFPRSRIAFASTLV